MEYTRAPHWKIHSYFVFTRFFVFFLIEKAKSYNVFPNGP